MAILGVLLFHLDPGLLPGGFLGVDIFFVISGFLITSILRREMSAGTFSFAGFYERRIRRIVPALYALLALLTVAGLAWMWPAQLVDHAKAVKAATLSLANFHFLGQSLDYFAEDTQRVPLLHTWSLAVEEQYYLLFPPMLLGILAWPRTGRRPRLVLGVMWVASFAGCVAYARAEPMGAFFLLPFRAWELLTGSLLAFTGRPEWLAKPAGRLAAWLGAAAVAASYGFARDDGQWHALGALAACLGAALLVLTGRERGPVAAALGWRPLVWIGLISYSVYLWHWPILVVARERLAPGLLTGAGLLAASVLAGWASWRWIETPFRRRGDGPRWRVFAVWGAATVVLLAGAAAIRSHKGFPGRYSAEVRELLAARERPGRFKPANQSHFDPGRAPVYGAPGVAPSFALWGDSHAESLLPCLDRLAAERGLAFRLYGLPGQVPVPGVTRLLDRPAVRARYQREVLERLLAEPALGTVILHGRWSVVYRPAGAAGWPPALYEREFPDAAALEEWYGARLRAAAARLLEAGKRVVIVGPVPEPGVEVPELLARQAHRGRPLTETIPCPGFAADNRAVLAMIGGLPADPRLRVLWPHERLLADGMLRIWAGGRPLFRDADHLSVAGAEELAGLLETALPPAPR